MTSSLRTSRSDLQQRDTEIAAANDQLGQEITERKRIEEELRRSRRRIVGVAEEVRRDFAAHLHGSAQNQLILILYRLTRLIDEAPSAQFAGRLGELRVELDNIIENDIRKISQQLYPAILGRGLTPALLSLGDRYGEVIALNMELNDVLRKAEQSNSKTIPENVRLAAYRITKEALNNVVKHAEAKSATVTLAINGTGHLRLSARDDGAGFDTEKMGDGSGVGTMEDYAEVVEGSFSVSSTVGAGTKVLASFPLELASIPVMG